MTLTTGIPSIAPEELAGRLARGERVTVLDVRDEATWPIEAPTVVVHHVAAATVLAAPERVARRPDGPIVVVCNRGVSARPVAEALRGAGADAQVLDGGMRGWLGVLQARTVDAGEPTIVQVQRPGRGCLSYLVASAGRALVADPAPDAQFYVGLAADLDVTISDVVDTHLHADHLSGARALAEATGATLRLPAGALDRGLAYADRVVAMHDGAQIRVGETVMQAVALPGHTTDMTGLLISDRALIAGDSLFADGVARPDLQRRDREGARAMARRLHRTLRERVLALPDDSLLLPGHTHPGVLPAAVAPRIAEVRARVPELSVREAEAFADALLADMPPRPANFELVLAVNAGAQPFDPELESGGNSCAAR